MSNIDAIISSIKEIFNMSEENISSLSIMLNNIDAKHIFNKFGSEPEEYNYSRVELISKTNLLNALMEIILENPNLDAIKNNERKKILVALYGTTASLYEQLIEQCNDSILENASYLVMYSMLSYLADRQTISNLVIDEYNEKLLRNKDVLLDMDIMKKLEFNTYYD